MNAFLLSTPYIEDCVKENFDIFTKSSIDTLYLLNENHDLNLHNSRVNNERYDISYIQSIESLKELESLELYIIYCDWISDSAFENIISFAQKTSNKIKVISNGYDHIKIRQAFNKISISIFDSGNFIGLNNDYIITRIDKKKPIVFICGFSFGNMQPKLELTLTEYFESHKITYDLFSYYCPFPQEKLVFDLTLESNILNRIEHAQNSNNHVMIFSLPLNLLSLSPENESAVSFLINSMRPDYSICCVNNNRNTLENINEVEELLKYKYNLIIDSFYVSNYSINNIEYFSENQPLLLNSMEYDVNLTDVLIVNNNANSLRRMIAELISKITFPTGITIV